MAGADRRRAGAGKSAAESVHLEQDDIEIGRSYRAASSACRAGSCPRWLINSIPSKARANTSHRWPVSTQLAAQSPNADNYVKKFLGVLYTDSMSWVSLLSCRRGRRPDLGDVMSATLVCGVNVTIVLNMPHVA